MIIAIICTFVYIQNGIPREDSVYVSSQERDHLGILLEYNDKYLVPVYVEVPYLLDEKDSIFQAIEYMKSDKKYGELSGFLNQSSYLNMVLLEEDIAYIDVSSNLFTVDKNENKQIAEAIVGIIRMNTSMQEVLLSEDGMLLGDIPYTTIPIKNMVYTLPINLFEVHVPQHKGIPFTTYSEIVVNDYKLWMPITKYIKGRMSVEFVMEEYSKEMYKAGLLKEKNSPLISYTFIEGILKLTLNRSICSSEHIIEEDPLNLLLLMLFTNLHPLGIELTIEEDVYLYRSQYKTIRTKDLIYNVLNKE